MLEHVENIDLTDKQYREVMALFERYIPDIEVWAYGSRVKFTSKDYSDLDLVVFISSERLYQVSELREAFDDSYLPFRVDLFIWDEIPEQFRVNIEREHVVLQAGLE